MPRNLGRLALRLREYLRGGSAITRIVPLSTGHSNETYLLEGLDRILRMGPTEEGLLPPYDMAFQHRVLSAVCNCPGGPPVPRVFELCTDQAVIGEPFFIMERLVGEAFESKIPAWLRAAPDAFRSRMCAQWIDAVIAVHRMPPETIAAPRMSPREEAQRWRDLAQSSEVPASLVDLLDDLIRHPPSPSGPPTPVHGDTKMGNCFWRDCKLVGVFDWEMAHIGEPLTDLGYLTSFFDRPELARWNPWLGMSGWWDRSRIVATWEEAAGRTARELDRYELLGICKIAAILARGLYLYRSGRATDPRFARWDASLAAYTELALRCAMGDAAPRRRVAQDAT